MAYEHIFETRGVVRRITGRSSDAEIFKAVGELHGDKRFDTLRYVLNDLSACAEVTFEHSAVEEVSAVDRVAEIYNPRIKIAIVATTPSTLAAAHAYKAAALNTYPTEIFATLSEARAWIGVAD